MSLATHLRRSLWTIALLVGGLSGSADAQMAIFSTPTDSPGNRAPVQVNQWFSDRSVQLWLDTGGTSPSPAGAECSGEVAGDEACFWQVECAATAGIEVVDIQAPADRPPDYIVSGIAGGGSSIRFNGGDPRGGEIGPLHIATLRIRSTGPQGEVSCGGTVVGATLDAVATPTATIAQTCGDELDWDCDGIDDSVDFCRYWPTDESLNIDSDGDGVGDPCQCGDANGDGTLTVADILHLNAGIFDPAQRGTLCDANNDGICSVSDILMVNRDLFDWRPLSTCRRQPFATTPFEFN